MSTVMRYYWRDAEDCEQISRQPPIDACRSPFGGTYTPNYRCVVLTEVEDEFDD
jgi:hypothetical protein